MSRENVEMTGELVDRWNRREWDWIRALAAPDFVFDMSRAVGLINGVHGLDQALQLCADFAAHWDPVVLEAEEFVDTGDQVVVPLIMHGRGRDGVELRARTGWVVSYRDGRLVRMTMFQDLEEALAAVGPTE
jgi:ketosteroid isomerase-like protein